MSSYVVSDSTVLAIASGLERSGRADDGIRQIADALKRFNAEAVAERYGEREGFDPVNMAQMRQFSDAEVCGSCRCYLYQVDVSEKQASSAIYRQVEALDKEIRKRNVDSGKWDTWKYFGDDVYSEGGEVIDFPWGLDDIERPRKINWRTRLCEKARSRK